MPKPSAVIVDLLLAGFLVICGFALAACKLAALSWDGSWYFFRSLQDGAPFIPHQRYGTYPILWLVVRASAFVADPRWLGILYGLLLSIIPVGALGISWYYLRGDKRAGLRIWPMLGILLTPLPGQFCLMSEATLTAQLLWPVLAVIVAGPIGLGGGVVLALLSAALWFLHPTATLIFVIAAVLSGWLARREPATADARWRWAGAFALLASVKLVFTLCYATEYERSQVSFSKTLSEAWNSLAGYPALMLILIYLLGFAFLTGNPLIPRRVRPGNRLTAPAICALITVLGSLWAADGSNWHGLLDYRRVVLPAAAPLLAFGFWQVRSQFIESTHEKPARGSNSLTAVAAAFTIVMSVQSLTWGSLTDRFMQGISAHCGPTRHFVTADQLPFVRRTPLDHWTASPLSILLQGRQPQAVFVWRTADIHSDAVQVNPWEEIQLHDAWFALAPLRPPTDGAH